MVRVQSLIAWLILCILLSGCHGLSLTQSIFLSKEEKEIIKCQHRFDKLALKCPMLLNSDTLRHEIIVPIDSVNLQGRIPLIDILRDTVILMQEGFTLLFYADQDTFAYAVEKPGEQRVVYVETPCPPVLNRGDTIIYRMNAIHKFFFWLGIIAACYLVLRIALNRIIERQNQF